MSIYLIHDGRTFGVLKDAVEYARLNGLLFTEELKTPIVLPRPAEGNKNITKIDYKLRENGLIDAIYPMNIPDMVEDSNKYSIIVHHTGHTDSVPRLIKFHMADSKWAAIGYHFLIDRDGNIIVTRPLKYRGAHCGGKNNKGRIGVAFGANLNEETMNYNVRNSYRFLIELLHSEYPIESVMGHNEFQLMKINEKLQSIGFDEIDPSLLSFKSKSELEAKKKDAIEVLMSKLVDNPNAKPYLDAIIMHVKKIKTCPGANFKKVVCYD